MFSILHFQSCPNSGSWWRGYHNKNSTVQQWLVLYYLLYYFLTKHKNHNYNDMPSLYCYNWRMLPQQWKSEYFANGSCFDFTGSSEMLMEGDLVVSNTRNALKCWNSQCLWRKSSDGLVEVPYTVSNQFCKWRTICICTSYWI